MVQCAEREGRVDAGVSSGWRDLPDGGERADGESRGEWVSVAIGERMGVGSARMSERSRIHRQREQ